MKIEYEDEFAWWRERVEYQYNKLITDDHFPRSS